MSTKPRQTRNTDWVEDYNFLITPKPQKDELLSSWLTRVAFAHGMTLNNFFGYFVRHEGHALTRTDIDFQYNPYLLDALSKKSKIDIKTIQNLSLRSEEGYLFACNECLYPPAQIRKLVDRRTHFGLMYCPKCLEEDEHPYFRQEWRYLFSNACIKHGIYLKDRCGICFERIRLRKMPIDNKIIFCHKCKRDLRLTRPIKVLEEHSEGLEAISWFQNGLKNGYFVIDNTKVSSLVIFQAFTHLRYLINGQKNLKLDSFSMLNSYKGLCKKLQHYDSKKCGPVYKDFFLTAIVYHLFQNYPNNLQKFADENNLTYRDFIHGFIDIPFWYKSTIDGIIPMQNTVGRDISKSEVIGVINYLKHSGIKVTQKSVAEIVGCHFSINKTFIRIYKQIT
ncbi:MAG: TniQ family protein [Sulfurimonas sp.]|nr:TniQ family protein [Sulfurimonas sp.]